MSDLVEFLRARFDEREATALKAAERDGKHWTTGLDHVGSETTSYIAVGPWEGSLAETGEHMARHDPAWVLADVEAKRRMIELHSAEPGQHPDFCWHDKHELPCPTLRLLALPYAKHPDYRQEWAPDVG